MSVDSSSAGVCVGVVAHASAKESFGEITSRAHGLADLAVEFDAFFIQVQSHFQVGDKLCQGFHLGGGGTIATGVEVAHQTYADGTLRVPAGVAAGKLFGPAIGCFDATIAHAVAVADKKMIADAFPVAAQMSLMNALDVSVPGGCVVYDNVIPGFPWLGSGAKRLESVGCECPVGLNLMHRGYLPDRNGYRADHDDQNQKHDKCEFDSTHM